jgi:hypothetical protein
LLAGIERRLAPRGVRWMNHPADIPILFDKQQSQSILAAREIAVPRRLCEFTGRSPADCEDMLAQLDSAGWSRVFVKLRFGSSASGVVALERSRAGMQATTSVELVREAGQIKLFNSLRIRRYTAADDLEAILDGLCRQQVHVEQWIPKASLAGRTFDLRVVVIAGQAGHQVVRTSRGPITNLHLGNLRGDLGELDSRWPPDARAAALEACRDAAALFPRSVYCGVDLALLPGLRRHAILELNAFGDLLPGIVNQRGDDTYAAALRAAISKT